MAWQKSPLYFLWGSYNYKTNVVANVPILTNYRQLLATVHFLSQKQVLHVCHFKVFFVPITTTFSMLNVNTL